MHILQKPWAIEFLNTPIQIYNFNWKSQEGGNSQFTHILTWIQWSLRLEICYSPFCYHFLPIDLPINKFSQLPFSEYVNLCCLEDQIFGQKIQIPEPQVIVIMVSNEIIFLKFQYSFDQKVRLAYMHIYETAFQKSPSGDFFFSAKCGIFVASRHCNVLHYLFQTLQCLALFEQKHNISWNWPWVAAQIGQRVHSEMEISNEGISRSSFCN